MHTHIHTHSAKIIFFLKGTRPEKGRELLCYPVVRIFVLFLFFLQRRTPGESVRAPVLSSIVTLVSAAPPAGEPAACTHALDTPASRVREQARTRAQAGATGGACVLVVHGTMPALP